MEFHGVLPLGVIPKVAGLGFLESLAKSDAWINWPGLPGVQVEWRIISSFQMRD